MQKLRKLLVVVLIALTLPMVTACDFDFQSSFLNPENWWENEQTPDDGNPDDGNPDDGNPDDGNPDDGNPDDGNPDDENPDIVYPIVGGGDFNAGDHYN